MRMRLMLLGGGSTLGQAILRQGAQKDIEFLAPRPPSQGWDQPSLDELFNNVEPDAVINMAYYSDWFQACPPDESLFPRQRAAMERLAELCHQRHAILLQPSSYRVFDGLRSVAYSERNAVHPLTPRGQQLAAVEELIKDSGCRHLVVRFGWLIDAGVGANLDRFLQSSLAEPELAMAEDWRGNPTTVADAARVLLAILQQLDCGVRSWGIYHYAGLELTNAFDLAQVLLTEAKSLHGLKVASLRPVSFHTTPQAGQEPQNGILACKRLLHTFGIKQHSWRAELPGMLKDYYADFLKNQ